MMKPLFVPVDTVDGNWKLRLVLSVVTVVTPETVALTPAPAVSDPVHTAPVGQHATWPAWSTAQLLSRLQHRPGAPSAAHAVYDVGQVVPPREDDEDELVACRFLRSWMSQKGS